MKGSRLHRALGAGIAIVVSFAACSDISGPEQHRGGPHAAIVDGSNTGVAGFHFLGKMSPSSQPAQWSGTFDPSRSPTISICELVDDACVLPALHEIPTDSISVDSSDEAYKAKWRKKSFDLSPGEVYRISVSVEGFQLGFADVVIRQGQDGLEALNAITGEAVTTNANGALPIHFRLETDLALPDPDLVAEYLFSNDLTDTSPMFGSPATQGMPNGGSFVADRFGAASAAYELSVAGQFIEVASAPQITALTEGLTISVWVKRGPGSLPESFVISRRSGTNAGIHFLVRIDSNNGFTFQHSGVGQPAPQYSVYKPVTSAYSTLNDGGWHHLAVTHDFGVGTDPKLYLDGSEIPGVYNFGSSSYDAPTVDESMYFGRQVSASPGYFIGLLDDVQLYSRALAPAEVAALCDLATTCS